jgi:hypothetical protein
LTASATIPASDISSGAALTKSDDTNVTLTLGGTPASALLAATSITAGWTGQLAVSRGGTGTGTAFTAGSVVFAGASGAYSQDNANFFWDDTNDRLGIGTSSPSTLLHVAGGSSPVVLNQNTVGSIASFTALGVTYGASFGVNADGTYVTSAANTVFSVSGSETMRISSAGNVGIGTTSPATKLEVADSGTVRITALNTTGTVKTQMLSDSTSGYLGTDSGHPLSFFTNQVVRATIDTGGNVGIGTSSPVGRLDAVSASATGNIINARNTSSSQFFIGGVGLQNGATANNSGVTIGTGVRDADGTDSFFTINKTTSSGSYIAELAYYDLSADFWKFSTSNAERMRIDSSGNVGIGTGSPGQKLTVAGTIETTSGGVKYPDGTTQTTGALEKVDVYSTAGSTTWTKPSWATSIEVILIGGGGGGGSGRKGAAGTLRCGGGGGSGGGFSTTIFPASYVGATETVTVGAGGTGGASQTTNSTNGNNATNGGDTSFGTKLYAPGGGGGAGGTASSGSSGTIARGTTAGGQGALSTSGGGSAAGIGATATGSTGSTYGGGGGGSVTTANAVTNGGQGVNTTTGTAPTWKIGGFSVVPTANSVTGNGNSGTDNGSGVWLGGESGDGGAASTSGNAFNGGNGAKWGSAGGGGGGAVDSVGNSGTGGDGGAGIAIVISRG